MYTDEQKKAHIMELQQLLYEMAHYNRRIPLIVPDGVFGPETEEALRVFQREYGLPQSGSADPDTWNKLVEINRIYYTPSFVLDIFDRDRIIVPGEAGPLVQIIQVMLNAAARKYANLLSIPLSGVYDEPTERAVAGFKRITRHSGSNEGFDREMWNKLVAIFRTIVV